MSWGSDAAFPFPPSQINYPYRTEFKKGEKGMTKREFIAAYLLREIFAEHPRMKSDRAAALAVERADALLREL